MPGENPIRADTFGEAVVRADERERVIDEMARSSTFDVERSRAGCALAISATVAGLVLVPAWAAIIGAAVWVFRVVSGAPLPW